MAQIEGLKQFFFGGETRQFTFTGTLLSIGYLRVSFYQDKEF